MLFEKVFNAFYRGDFDSVNNYLKFKRFFIKFFCKNRPDKSDYYLLKGVAHYNQGRLHQALVSLRTSLKFDSMKKNYGFAIFFIVQVLLEKNKSDKTGHNKLYPLLNELILNKQYIYGHQILINDILPRIKNIDCKITCEIDNIKEDISGDDYSIACCYFLRKEYRNSLAAIIKTDLQLFYNYLLYLRILFRLGEYNQIVAFFIESEKSNFPFDALYIISGALYKLSLDDKTLMLFNRFNKTTLKKNSIMINKAKIFYRKRKVFYLINYLNKISCAKSNDEMDYLYFLKGLSLQKIGSFKDAERNYNNVSEDSRLYKKTLFNLAILYYDTMEREKYNIVLSKIYELSRLDSSMDFFISKIKNYHNFDDSVNVVKSKLLRRLLSVIFFFLFSLIFALFFWIILLIKK